MGHQEHKARVPQSVACAVITVSDTRTPETDTSGRLIQRMIEETGHRVVGHHLVKDDPDQIRQAIERSVAGGAGVILLTGGTGIAPRDTTYEVVEGLLEKRLDGFGEIFRMLSYREIGSAAMLSRAVAGTYKGKAIFSMPGSEAAVRLALEKLILPELGHLARELG
jgi:molybdenum cofactor biosynthesis protein B